MPLMICPKCDRFHYVPGDCPPARSTAARMDVRSAPDGPTNRAAKRRESPAGTQSPPVDIAKVETETAHLAPKNKGGRPRIHPDRKAYKADAERKRRAKLKAQ